MFSVRKFNFGFKLISYTIKSGSRNYLLHLVKEINEIIFLDHPFNEGAELQLLTASHDSILLYIMKKEKENSEIHKNDCKFLFSLVIQKHVE